MPTRRSQFDALSAVYSRFIAELKSCGHPPASWMAESLEQSNNKMSEWLSDPASGVTRSKLAAGMKQGLRDFPLGLRDYPKPVGSRLVSALRTIIQEEAPDLLADEREKLSRIVKRGRVRNESEFYLVRYRVDEIEGHAEHRAELVGLLKLLDDFEASTQR
jgi:hypothetical protein